MRTPDHWPAVRTERSHSFVRTERADSAYILLTTPRRLLGARSAAYLIIYLPTLKSSTSLDSHHIHTCMYVMHGHVPSTEFCRRSQAVICVNDIENINYQWREGGAPLLNAMETK